MIKTNKNVKNIVNPLRPYPINGQTQSNYSLTIADILFECVWPLIRIKFERVKTQDHFDICVKPTWWIYLLQSLQGHSYGRQFFIPDLNKSRFRKGFSAQHSLLKLLEKWRQSLDQGLVFGVLLTFIGFWLPFPWTIGSKIKCLWSTYLSSSFYLWLFN